MVVLHGTREGLRIGQGATVAKVSFRALQESGSAIVIPSSSVGAIIDGCTFEMGKHGVGVRVEPGGSRCVVRNCHQIGGESLVYAEATADMRVEHNVTLNVARGLRFSGGRRNTVSNNIVLGGVAGIIFLSNRNLGAENVTTANQIIGNWLILTREEGVSFDCHGDKPDKWPEISLDPPLKAIGKRQSDILVSVEGADDGWANGFHLVALSGASVGAHSRIVASTSAALTLADPEALTDVAANDYLLVTSGFFRNRIADNRVFGAGTYGVGCWGSSWDNEIVGNIVSDSYSGILVASAISGEAGKLMAVSGNIQIVGNTVIRGATAHADHWMRRGDIVVYAHRFGPGEAPPFPLNPGVVMRDNDIRD